MYHTLLMRLVRNKGCLLLKGSALSHGGALSASAPHGAGRSLGGVCEELGSEPHGQSGHIPAGHGAETLVGIVPPA